jgi:predicted nucleic acid-binding protein
MTASFVDTNVLVYVYDHDEPAKRERAKELVSELAERDALVVSTQVLQELYVTLTRKLARKLDEEDAAEVLAAWSQLPTVLIDAPLILSAAATSREAKVSFWDALILESAVRHGCDRLLTEDLQDGFVHKGVRVEDPFGPGSSSET